MGAWNTGPFDNDEGLDFLDELQDEPSWATASEALRKAISIQDYLELAEGASAFAAAALIAGADPGEEYGDLPGRLGDPTAELVALAVQAIQRVLSEKSEMRELWAASNDYPAWLSGIESVRERLVSSK